VLAAVVNLESEDGAARQELYERARRIIISELRKQNPKISALTITREQAALEAAIRRLEAELQPRARDNERKGSPHGRSDVAPPLPAALVCRGIGRLLCRARSRRPTTRLRLFRGGAGPTLSRQVAQQG
jgi:hypothetical protein